MASRHLSFLPLLALLLAIPCSLSFSENTSSQSCAQCYLKYIGEDYRSCISAHCGSIFLTPSSLFSSPHSVSKACATCSTVSKSNYNNCIAEHCKQEILDKALEFSALHPYSLLSTMPLSDKTSFVCQMEHGESVCFKYEWANDDVKLTKFTKSGSRCVGCDQYVGEAYRSCSTFHCREEIERQLLRDEPMVRPLQLSQCTDACYQEYLEKGHDYSNCVRMKCKRSKIGMVYKEETSLCNSCKDLEDTEYMYKCVSKYCKEEILVQLSRKENFVSVGCEINDKDSEDELALDTRCKEIIVHASFEYFASTGAILGEKQNQCGSCAQFVERDDHLTACILVYCSDKILDKTLYLKNEKETLVQSECLEQCMESKGLDAVCYSIQCIKEIKTLYKLYLNDIIIKENKNSHDYANKLLNLHSSKCHANSCKPQIPNKETLFTSSKIVFSPRCKACLHFEGSVYSSCISKNCQQEIENKSLLFAATTPEILLFSRPIVFTSCKSCASYFSPLESMQQYHCISQNCKSEFFNKQSLITPTTNFNCAQCEQFSGTEIHNCAFFFCKSSAMTAFESYKSQNSLSISPNIINLNECTDSCFYDWYYYGYDFHTCAYEYCRTASIGKPPIALRSKIAFSDYLDLCIEADPFCAANLCQVSEFSELLMNRIDFQCKVCAEGYTKGRFTQIGLAACLTLNCLDQLEKLFKEDKTVVYVRRIAEEKVISEENLNELCEQALNGEADVDYRMCYPFFNSFVNKAFAESGSGIGYCLMAAAVMVSIISVLAYTQKLLRRFDTPSTVIQHYQRLVPS